MVMISILIVVAIMIFALVNSKTDHKNVQNEVANKMYGSDNDDLLKNLETETRRIQAFIQANIVGDRFVADAINGGTYNGPLPEKRDDGGCGGQVHINEPHKRYQDYLGKDADAYDNERL